MGPIQHPPLPLGGAGNRKTPALAAPGAFSVIQDRSGLAAAAFVMFVAGISSASAQSIQAQYLLNDYDYQQPNVLAGTTSDTLYQDVGGGFYPAPYPPSWGSPPTLGQTTAFGNATTVTAEQNGVTISIPYEGFSGAPYEHATAIPYTPGLSGAWNLTVNSTYPTGNPINPIYPTANIQTYSIPSNVPTMIPFVTNTQLSNETPNATISWTNPSFSIPSGTVRQTVLLITNMQTKNVVGDFVLSSGQTSFNLSQLGSIESDGFPTEPLTAGTPYQLSVQASLYSATGSELYATSRSFTDFIPSNASSSVSGPIYLPSISVPVSGSAVYGFDINVTAGDSYNIDPASAEGFVYRIGSGDPNFASVDLPDIGNSNPYELLVWNGAQFVFADYLDPNTVFDFAQGGVSAFEVLGIDPGADINLISGNAFITTVTFAGSGTFTGTMTAVIPEPSTWALLGLGFGGLGLMGWRRSLARAAVAS
jgi:PEP-CTERM motif